MKYCFHIAAICRTLFTHFPSARIMDTAIMKLHEGNVFPSARIASICGSNSLILVYFLDITKPPRVVLLSYTGRLFIYCLLFTDRFRLSFRRAYYICLIFFSLSIPHKLLRVSSWLFTRFLLYFCFSICLIQNR